MRKVTHVEVLRGYRVALTFDDGTAGAVELFDLTGKGVFACRNDPAAFARVRIGSFGELVWGDQADLRPDAPYLKGTGKQPDEVFPALRAEPARV
jgi:hypothetical protein